MIMLIISCFVAEMISYISENSRVTLQLVGGLKEESGKGGVLSKRILSYFATHRCNFIPSLVCLGSINTKIRTRAEPIVGKILILHNTYFKFRDCTQ